MGWDGMGWGGMEWDGMGWGGMGMHCARARSAISCARELLCDAATPSATPSAISGRAVFEIFATCSAEDEASP